MVAELIIFLISISAFSVYGFPFPATEENRTRRSGGQPKFPYYSQMECGVRAVPHYPHRSGGATPKIIGGSTVPYGAYPWQVDIQSFNGLSQTFEHLCGGAVVGDRVIMTAAHCLRDLKKSQLRMVVGKHHLSGSDSHERTYRVEKVIVHPEFRRGNLATHEGLYGVFPWHGREGKSGRLSVKNAQDSPEGPHSNDIALIKVKAISEGGIGFNTYIQPICLPGIQAKRAETGDWCTVTGWGAQKPEDLGSLSPELRAASVPLLDLATCRASNVYGSRQKILDSMLCAGLLDGGVDACGGDSGGPLACQVAGRFELTGIVSWGDGCAKKNKPGVYTRVSHYLPWIFESLSVLTPNVT